MERIIKKSGKFLLILAPVCFLLPFALAEDNIRMGEDYYGNDIEAAVLEAQRNDRKVNYSNRYWYNRSTSQSFDLPKLGSQALEQERLEGALQPTAAGKVSTPDTIPDEEQTRTLQNNLEQSTTEQETSITLQAPAVIPPSNEKFVPEIFHQFPRGDTVTTRNLTTNGNISSTPRP
ncbi:MAG: hypothetical protein CL679_07045 [Bermanella sp.]|nr:hypothetical protein [Bermanella sp.]|tara:strand:- start:836 stop:1363 length:528 start_codon:yes stop_codon:yes gene_type:complete